MDKSWPTRAAGPPGAPPRCSWSTERLALLAGLVPPDAAVDAGHVDAVDEVRKLTDGRGADVIITAAASGAAQLAGAADGRAVGRLSLFGGLPKDNPVIACATKTWCTTGS